VNNIYFEEKAYFEITLTALVQINVKLMVLQEEPLETCLVSNDNTLSPLPLMANDKMQSFSDSLYDVPLAAICICENDRERMDLTAQYGPWNSYEFIASDCNNFRK
jgi:hypothetical protein